MNSKDFFNSYRVWKSDEAVPEETEKKKLTYYFKSPRIGGDYKVTYEAAMSPMLLSQEINTQETKRLKAQLATTLIDRIRHGDMVPLVDKALVEYIHNKTKPLPIAKRARRLLRFLVESTNSIDQIIDFSQHRTMEEALGSSESTTIAELDRLLEYLMDIGLIERVSASGYFRVTIRGFESIEQEASTPQVSDQVFVALWFDESTKKLRSVIENTIRQSGYKPIIVDNQVFDGLIDDAIVAGIRAAKFVIADLTHGENGMRGSVYYEAGLARGQEKSVILTCEQDLLDDRGVAFDLNHYPIITWTKEDLPKFSQKLCARIEALFGKGPGL
ncbi:MAG: hypothetical protein OXG88_07580 [Gammaproteobacteria bacterium]|nr:hypothetical protein [Gammaproteobacteria bacterium]